jgi:hypothetical protein
MRAKTGDIALVLMLSPFEQSLIPTAVCAGMPSRFRCSCLQFVQQIHWLHAVSVMLPDDPDLSDVRDWQVRQLFRGIELFNADFCLPVVIGGSVASTPSSPLYHLITQGFPKVEPQPPEAPAPPTVEVLSMASLFRVVAVTRRIGLWLPDVYRVSCGGAVLLQSVVDSTEPRGLANSEVQSGSHDRLPSALVALLSFDEVVTGRVCFRVKIRAECGSRVHCLLLRTS